MNASAIVFIAPEASGDAFAQHLLQKNQQSYTQWSLKEASKTRPVLPSVSKFVQDSLENHFTDEKELQWAWEKLRTTENLGSEDRELLLLLAEKRGLNLEVCRILALDPALEKKLQDGNSSKSCKKFLKPLPQSTLKTLNRDELLSIDGKVFLFEHIPSALVPGVYNWKVISNRSADRDVVASPESLIASLPPPKPWVEGTCESAKLLHPEFNVLAQATVFFTESCVPAGLPAAPSTQSWAAKNKSWLWGVSLVIAGAAAYSLRNKDLIILTP